MWHLSRRTIVITHWQFWAWLILLSDWSTCGRGLTDYRCWYKVKEGGTELSVWKERSAFCMRALSLQVSACGSLPFPFPITALLPEAAPRILFCSSSYGMTLHTGSQSINPPFPPASCLLLPTSFFPFVFHALPILSQLYDTVGHTEPIENETT